VIRSALRVLESEENKERELIKALEVGEKRGFVEGFDPNQNLIELHGQHL
jgi:antitoxin ParD1/3/4